MIGLSAVPWREDIEEDMVRIWTDSMFSIHQRCGRGPRRRGVKNQKKEQKAKSKRKKRCDRFHYLSIPREDNACAEGMLWSIITASICGLARLSLQTPMNRSTSLERP